MKAQMLACYAAKNSGLLHLFIPGIWMHEMETIWLTTVVKCKGYIFYSTAEIAEFLGNCTKILSCRYPYILALKGAILWLLSAWNFKALLYVDPTCSASVLRKNACKQDQKLVHDCKNTKVMLKMWLDTKNGPK